MPSAISARVNQNRIGPRRRGSAGPGAGPGPAGRCRRRTPPGRGTPCSRCSPGRPARSTARAAGCTQVRSGRARWYGRRGRPYCMPWLGAPGVGHCGVQGPAGGPCRSLRVTKNSTTRRDDRQRPREPEDAPRVADQRERRDHADDEQGHGAAPLVEGDGGLAGLLVRHEQPAGAVQDQAGAAEEGEHDERDPQDERVDVEVPGQAAGDAGHLAVVGGAAEPAEVAHLVARDSRAPVVRGPGRRAGGCFGWCRGHVLKPVPSAALPPSGDDPDPWPGPAAPGSGCGRGCTSWLAAPALCDD